MEDLSQSNCEVNSFGRWQADYAAHGVATFPVDANSRCTRIIEIDVG
jgi:hypothetical protein